MRHGDAKQRRKDLFEEEYESIKGQSGNDDADDIFDKCYELAINGEGPNFTVGGGAKTAAEIDEIRAGWRTLGEFDTEKIHGFHSYRPQDKDKAKAGKANVGATLEKRKLQADFLVFFGARKINAHVNVKD